MQSGIAPDVWLRQTDADIATAIHLLAEQGRENSSPSSGGGPQMSG